MLNAVELLYTTEYKTLDSQTAIGVGLGNENGTSGGSNAYASNSTPNAYVGACRYRGIESLWGISIEWVNGMLFAEDNPMTVYWTNDTTKYGEESSTGWNVLGETMGVSGGGGYWADMMTLTGIIFPFMIPNSYGGSSSTKFCDYGYTPNNFVGTFGCYCYGGTTNAAGQGGFWYRETNDRNRGDQYLHSRLSYLPQ